MTPEIEKKRRELFEKIMSQKYSAAIGWHERDENGYLMATIRDQWTGFNAALDAMVIELPKLRGDCALESIGGSLFDSGHDSGIEKSKEAITATGLGLRIK